MRSRIAAVSLATFTGVANATVQDQLRLRQEFIAAMHQKPKVAAARKMGRAQKIKKLHEGLINASRKLQYSDSSTSQGQQQDQQQQYAEQDQYTEGQQLYDENGNPYEENPLDLSAHAFKYSGCAAIKSYDEEKAEENGNPMVVNNYAVFRLCPADQCNDFSLTGCTKNYGEYTVDLKTYLQSLMEYYDDRYEEYCEYCLPCDMEQQQLADTATNLCYQETSAQNLQALQQMQQQAYQDFIGVNGENSGTSFQFQGTSPYNNGQGFDSYNGLYYNGANTKNGFNNPTTDYNYQQEGQNADQGGQNYTSNSYTDEGSNAGGAYYSGTNNGNQAADGKTYDGGAYNANRGATGGAYYGWAYDENQRLNAYDICQTGLQKMQSVYDGSGEYDPYSWFIQNAQAASSQNGEGGYYDENSNNYDQYDANAGSFETTTRVVYWNNMDCCLDGSICDQCQVQTEVDYGHCDDYVCGDYYTYCSDMYGGKAENLTEFLECSLYESEDGEEFYIGPHCGDDHYTISLGVFSDENCLNYLGESISLSSVLGNEYTDEDLFQFSKECISCDGMEEYEEKNNQTEGRYGGYATAPDTDADGAFAMCSTLFDVSAQCSKNMNNFETISEYMSQNELSDEDRVCTFIDNIMYGSYDESGEIQLRSDSFDMAGWRNPEQYKKLRLPTGQAILLSFSIVLCVALAAAAFTLQRAFRTERFPWTPQRLFRRRYTQGQIGKVARRPSMGDSKPPVSMSSRVAIPDGDYHPAPEGVQV